MATTPNLEITHIVSSQAQKEVTANAAFDEFDGAISDLFDVDFTADTDITPAKADALLNAYFTLTGTITAARNMIVPVNKKFYTVINSTGGGFAVTVKTSAGSGISVANGTTKILYCDGTNVVDVK